MTESEEDETTYDPVAFAFSRIQWPKSWARNLEEDAEPELEAADIEAAFQRAATGQAASTISVTEGPTTTHARATTIEAPTTSVTEGLVDALERAADGSAAGTANEAAGGQVKEVQCSPSDVRELNARIRYLQTKECTNTKRARRASY